MTSMKISLIAAMSLNRAIGYKGRLPWPHLPADWANFFEVTAGCRMIMGRKSYDTPDRLSSDVGNFVITKQTDLAMDDGFERVSSLEEALARCQNDPEVFVIGGGEVFSQAMPLSHCIHLTVVKDIFEGDAFFPDIPDEFQLVDQRDFEIDHQHPLPFSFLVYQK
jgi:dihydrofolate reductase